jgi:hypothetical protein
VGEGQARDERGGVQPCQALDRPLHQGTAPHAEHELQYSFLLQRDRVMRPYTSEGFRESIPTQHLTSAGHKKFSKF